jgi:streptogramin lyase
MWIGTAGNGVSKFDRKGFTIFNSTCGLRNNMVFSLLSDSKENIWMGTNGGGVSKYSGKDFFHYSQKDGLPSDFICSVIEDKNGNIWFGTEGGGASKFDGKKFKNYSTKDGLPSNIIISMSADRNGNIWFATGGGGVSRFDPSAESFKNFTMEDGLGNNYVRPILEDRNGNIWFGTEGGGISKYDGSKFVNYTTKNGLANNFVRAILEDVNGTLWFATQRGLCKFDGKGNFTTYSKEKGLRSENLLQLKQDNEGNIWVGHFEGIEKFDPKTERFKYYGYLEGFTPMENNGRAICKDKNGNIWFGTIAGAVKYDPKEDMPNKIEPLTHITQIKVNGELKQGWSLYSDSAREKLPAEHELAFDHNNISFDFVGIHFTIPEKIRYQYKLDGFDKSWSNSGENTAANYTNLEPGDYTFLVKSANNESVWNKEAIPFYFTIRPPYWETWWFYFAQFSFFACLLLGSLYFKRRDAGSKTASILTFVCLALILEFINYNLEPLVEALIANSAPYLKIGTNLTLGALINPVEGFVKRVLWRL